MAGAALLAWTLAACGIESGNRAPSTPAAQPHRPEAVTEPPPQPRVEVPTPTPPGDACALGEPPAAEELLAAIPVAERSGTTPRALSIELDGRPPSEAVLTLERLPAGVNAGGGQSTLWVLRRAGVHRWTVVGHESWPMDAYWEGSYDGTPGFRIVRREALLGRCQDVLRVEHLNFRGSVAPKFWYRTFDLLVLDGDHLARAFGCPTADDASFYGARSVRRVIRFLTETLPARIHVTRTSEWIGDGPPEDGIAAHTHGESDYTFVSSRWTSPRDVCSD